jgi:hypothetical protein
VANYRGLQERKMADAVQELNTALETLIIAQVRLGRAKAEKQYTVNTAANTAPMGKGTDNHKRDEAKKEAVKAAEIAVRVAKEEVRTRIQFLPMSGNEDLIERATKALTE